MWYKGAVPSTREALLAAAAVEREEARRLKLEALNRDTYADELEALAAKAPGRLTIGAKRSMVSSNMEASSLAGKSERVRTSANRARVKSAARDAMIASGHTAGDLAKACGVKRPTANAWLTGQNAISPANQALLAKPPFSIPPPSWLKRGE